MAVQIIITIILPLSAIQLIVQPILLMNIHACYWHIIEKTSLVFLGSELSRWEGLKKKLSHSRQAVAVKLFLRLTLPGTPSVGPERHRDKDGDVLMHACQKITAQLLIAKSHVGMAGEKLSSTPGETGRRVRESANKHRSVTESLFQDDVWGTPGKVFKRSLSWKHVEQSQSWMSISLSWSFSLPWNTHFRN